MSKSLNDLLQEAKAIKAMQDAEREARKKKATEDTETKKFKYHPGKRPN